MKKDFYKIFQNLDFESYKLLKKGIEISGDEKFFQLKHLFLAFDILKPDLLKIVFSESFKKELINFLKNLRVDNEVDNKDLFIVLDKAYEIASEKLSLINTYILFSAILCTENNISRFLNDNYFELEIINKKIDEILNEYIKNTKYKEKTLKNSDYEKLSSIFKNLTKKEDF